MESNSENKKLIQSDACDVTYGSAQKSRYFQLINSNENGWII